MAQLQEIDGASTSIPFRVRAAIHHFPRFESRKILSKPCGVAGLVLPAVLRSTSGAAKWGQRPELARRCSFAHLLPNLTEDTRDELRVPRRGGRQKFLNKNKCPSPEIIVPSPQGDSDHSHLPGTAVPGYRLFRPFGTGATLLKCVYPKNFCDGGNSAGSACAYTHMPQRDLGDDT
jgi:hypothetical protein